MRRWTRYCWHPWNFWTRVWRICRQFCWRMIVLVRAALTDLSSRSLSTDCTRFFSNYPPKINKQMRKKLVSICVVRPLTENLIRLKICVYVHVRIFMSKSWSSLLLCFRLWVKCLSRFLCFSHEQILHECGWKIFFPALQIKVRICSELLAARFIKVFPKRC